MIRVPILYEFSANFKGHLEFFWKFIQIWDSDHPYCDYAFFLDNKSLGGRGFPPKGTLSPILTILSIFLLLSKEDFFYTQCSSFSGKCIFCVQSLKCLKGQSICLSTQLPGRYRARARIWEKLLSGEVLNVKNWGKVSHATVGQLSNKFKS